MRLRFVTLLLLVAWSVPAVPAASAATTELEPVVVTAGRIEEKPKSVTQPVTVIARDVIEKNQYQDLGGLLRNYGVQIDAYSPNSALSTMTIRGMRSSAMGSDLQGGVLLLVDGRRTGTSNVSMIPMINIERIEIVRGPASVQYGTSAIGGVVNIITRRGTSTPRAAVEAGYGSWDTVRGQGEGAWAYGPFDFSGGFSDMKAGDYKTGDNRRYYNSGLNHKVGYSANLGYTFWDQHRIGLVAQGVDGHDMGSPGAINDIQHTAYTNRHNNSVDLTYDGGTKDTGLGWKARYFHGDIYYRNTDPQDAWGMAYFKNQTEYQGAQGQLSFNKSFLTLTGGVDWLKYDTRSDTRYYPQTESSVYDNTGVFMLAKLAFFKDTLIFSGGLRHDLYNVKITDKDTDFDRTTPSVGAAWSPLDWLTLRANYGEAYRVPDPQGLLGFDAGFITYVGNRNLKPEKGKGWDAGFEINYKALNLGLTYFQTDYKDKIITRTLGSGEAQYYNLSGTVEYQGLEGQAGFDLGEAFAWPFVLRPYMNMTWLITSEDNLGRSVPGVNNMDLAYGLNFQHPDMGLSLDLRATYYGHRQEQDFDYTSSTYMESLRTGGETVVDFFLSQALCTWKDAGTLSLKGELRNMFNVNYQAFKDYPLPGRSFWVGLRYDY